MGSLASSLTAPDLAGQHAVGLRPVRVRRPGGDRLARHRGLREPDGAVDHRVEHEVAERLDDAVAHLPRVHRARVEHRGQDADDLEIGVEPVLHLVDGVHQQRDPAQREELAGQRDEDALGAGQGVDREQAERRLAVDEDHVVAIEHRLERPAERLLAADLGDQLHLGGRQVDVGREEVHPLDRGGADDVVDLDAALHEQVVDRGLQLVGLHAEADRERALRVEVHQEHPAAVLGERRAEVDGGRRLADATLLVRHRDHPGRAVLLQRSRFGNLQAVSPHGAGLLGRLLLVERLSAGG